MILVDYKDVIERRFCSAGFISILHENHKEEDIQLFLSVATGKYSIDELSRLTGLSPKDIKNKCLVLYNKYFLDEPNYKPINYRLGWIDSSRHIQNPRMGSSKGY